MCALVERILSVAYTFVIANFSQRVKVGSRSVIFYKSSIAILSLGDGCPRTQFAEKCSSKMTGKNAINVENPICAMDYADESRLNSDNLQPEISVGGVLERPGGGNYWHGL